MEFEAIVLETPVRRVKTFSQLLGQYLSGACQLFGDMRNLRSVRTLIVFSHFALVVKLCARLGLVRYQRLFCFGFFLHNPRWFRWFRWLRRIDRVSDYYILFSESELLLYRAELGIDAERLHYIPLGDWRKTRAGQPLVQRSIWGDYHFAAGRSNRDYGALVDAFRTIPAKLLIVCSHSNLEDPETSALPDNISVVCDVSAAKFDEMISCAKAGIIPLRHDTGSAGQSVALTLMRHAKCVLATRVGGLARGTSNMGSRVIGSMTLQKTCQD